jgi:hypothetical protein
MNTLDNAELDAATTPVQCRAVAKSGEPCRAFAIEGSDLCHLHAHPEMAKEIGRRGGEQNRHFDPKDDQPDLGALKTAEDVRQMLAQAAADLRCRKIEPRMAAGLSQLATMLLKAIEVADLQAKVLRLEEKLYGSQETN